MNEGRPVIIVLTAAAILSLLFCLGQLPTPGQAAQPQPTAPPETQPMLQLLPALVPEEPSEPAPSVSWQGAEEMDGSHIFVYDCSAEKMLYCSTDRRESLYPASITKLFSAWVALQYLHPEEELQAGRELGLLQPGSSTAYIAYGSVLTVQMLVEGMLLPSGNDAAYVLAAGAGRVISGEEELSAARAVECFVEEMNRQAELLDLRGTHFENPDGYHSDGHYTNFNDLVEIAKLSLKNEKLMEFARLPKATVLPVLGEKKEWINTNLLVNPETDYYCPYAIGLKTGQTQAAGSCLLSAFDIEGHQYIIGVFGSPKFNDKLDDTLQLFNEIVMEQ